MTYRLITTKDREYAREKELRNRVLRKPLGLSLSEQDLRGEDEQLHLVAMDGSGEVVGCVLVAFPGNGAKFRQIAVDERHRGQGIGAGLLRRAEQEVRKRGISRVTLHARVLARRFFERQGYRVASEVFAEVTIPHLEMEKDLAQEASRK